MRLSGVRKNTTNRVTTVLYCSLLVVFCWLRICCLGRRLLGNDTANHRIEEDRESDNIILVKRGMWVDVGQCATTEKPHKRSVKTPSITRTLHPLRFPETITVDTKLQPLTVHCKQVLSRHSAVTVVPRCRQSDTVSSTLYRSQQRCSDEQLENTPEKWRKMPYVAILKSEK